MHGAALARMAVCTECAIGMNLRTEHGVCLARHRAHTCTKPINRCSASLPGKMFGASVVEAMVANLPH
eukprot:6674810-Heterocapsa_arctica.AAC.1